MRAQILDVDALRAISPIALAAYAQSEGWERSDNYGDHANIYTGHDRPEIILPRTNKLVDYPRIVSRLIEIFASVADRSELEIYRDLVGADRDIVRIRSFGIDDNGTVPLDSGVKIVERSRDLLLAAACSTQSPRSIYRAGANKEANEYMDRVRLGQTEHGSFVVTLLSPVPSPIPLRQIDLDLGADLPHEPIETQVARRLIQALKAAKRAIERTLSGNPEAFENSIRAGVSANLCEAVADLVDQSKGLDVSVTWARTRPVREPRQKVSFSPNDAEILRKAGRTFRLKEPQSGVTLYGTVNQLKREHDDEEGIVNLRAIVNDRMQSVRALLDQVNYSSAVSAHQNKLSVIATGDLVRNGERWQLINANIRPIPVDDDGISDHSDLV